MKVVIIPNKFYPCFQYMPAEEYTGPEKKVVEISKAEMDMVDDAVANFLRMQAFLSMLSEDKNAIDTLYNLD